MAKQEREQKKDKGIHEITMIQESDGLKINGKKRRAVDLMSKVSNIFTIRCAPGHRKRIP